MTPTYVSYHESKSNALNGLLISPEGLAKVERDRNQDSVSIGGVEECSCQMQLLYSCDRTVTYDGTLSIIVGRIWSTFRLDLADI
jgi:hypothetical protein